MKEFDDLIAQAKGQARRAGLQRRDIAASIKKVRAHK
jgi:hypothetical protein